MDSVGGIEDMGELGMIRADELFRYRFLWHSACGIGFHPGVMGKALKRFAWGYWYCKVHSAYSGSVRWQLRMTVDWLESILDNCPVVCTLLAIHYSYQLLVADMSHSSLT